MQVKRGERKNKKKREEEKEREGRGERGGGGAGDDSSGKESEWGEGGQERGVKQSRAQTETIGSFVLQFRAL